ncbi:glycosyltransferase family 4 protein [Aeromicrobium wangtongii]|uniref:glycosyltransferase family 4 protein n=1 Tax=Aeromicrobium wangtongii TaxID=2969247 RepID=UPI00201720D9|nr:glycosyltransferase family 4 protein [Aeromicrobium wangtongii]MCL3817852.1 glycosyltransferase family 4 protein [Aeromicrobium wangtongii]
MNRRTNHPPLDSLPGTDLHRLRLLLVAPTIDGTDVGESWVAHQWASHLSERFDTTVLTYRKRGRPSAAAQLPRARVVEWLEPRGLGRAERLNSLAKPGYVPFYLRARRWIREALARGERFDIGHQPLPVAMRYPSPLAGLGIPYVLGPVGGSLDSPAGFEDGDTAPWYVGLRRADAWRLQHDRLLRRTYEDAAVVLGIAPYVGDALRAVPVRDLRFLAETALDVLPDRRPVPHGPTVHLLFVGRLVRTKGAREAIRAMAMLREHDVVLDVVGDGFDRAECERLVAELDLGGSVRFHGSRSRSEVEQFYRSADVFVFPSFREPGGNVVFEAMGHHLPVVTCDRGGPGAAVDDTCGIRVPVQSPDQLVRDLADAITTLVADPHLRSSMGDAARARVERIGLWPAKVDQISQLYASVRRELDAPGGPMSPRPSGGQV